MPLTFAKATLAAWTLIVAAGMFRGCDPLPTPIPTATTSVQILSATPSPEPFPAEATVLTILHTNDVRGEVDPCG